VLDRVTKRTYYVPCEEALFPGTATLERFSTGQACFTPHSKRVVYCKFRAFPSQLGITYCNNRPSELKLGLLRDLYDARSVFRKERVAERRRQGIDDDDGLRDCATLRAWKSLKCLRLTLSCVAEFTNGIEFSRQREHPPPTLWCG
jgi:hypothetical protein